MRNIVTFFLASVLLLAGCGKSEPKIIISHNVGINYVTHLYTLAGLGFADVEYSGKYYGTLSQEDLAVLLQNSRFLRFGQGATGVFTNFMFFIPAYADLKSKSDFEKYFKAVNEAILTRNPASLLKYVPKNNQENIQSMAQMDDQTWEQYMSLLPAFNAVAQVYVDNIDRYLSDVYPKIEKDLIIREDQLNTMIEGNHFLAEWEKVTGLEWKYGDYTYLLFRAGKDGPSFNNLSENMNSFYYLMDDGYTVDMISHEFGIFLMFDDIIPIFVTVDEKYPQESGLAISWMAFESLAVYYNCQIKGDKTSDYYNFSEADAATFYEIYDQLHKSGITNPTELYQKGIDEYMSKH